MSISSPSSAAVGVNFTFLSVSGNRDFDELRDLSDFHLFRCCYDVRTTTFTSNGFGVRVNDTVAFRRSGQPLAEG